MWHLEYLKSVDIALREEKATVKKTKASGVCQSGRLSTYIYYLFGAAENWCDNRGLLIHASVQIPALSLIS